MEERKKGKRGIFNQARQTKKAEVKEREEEEELESDLQTNEF